MNHIKACCKSVAQTGFGTLQISEAMLLDYKKSLMGTPQYRQPPRPRFPSRKTPMDFSPLALSTRALRISQTCVSDFVIGLRIHQNEELLNSHKVNFLPPLMLLNNRSASLPRN